MINSTVDVFKYGFFFVIILRHRATENIKEHRVDLQGEKYRRIQFNISGNENDNGSDKSGEKLQ